MTIILYFSQHHIFGLYAKTPPNTNQHYQIHVNDYCPIFLRKKSDKNIVWSQDFIING